MKHLTWKRVLVAVLAIAGALWFATFMRWDPPHREDTAPFGAGETVRPPVDDAQVPEQQLER